MPGVPYRSSIRRAPGRPRRRMGAFDVVLNVSLETNGEMPWTTDLLQPSETSTVTR
jgi:hypothetical protein